MWDFSARQAMAMMARTAPFIVFRMAVYFGAAVAYMLMTGVGAGVGWGVGGFGDEDFRAAATLWGGVAGFGITAAVMYLLREYLLYVVKAGHVAVLVDLMDGKTLSQGRSQISHARAEVTARFGQTSTLFAVDQLIKGVLKAITGLLRGMMSIIPVPGARQIVSVVQAFLKIAVGFIDEVILAYAIRTGSDNAWQSAREGLVLYGQNYKVMLKNAAWLALIVYGLSFVVFLIMLAPAGLAVYLIPGAWSAGGMVFALLLAWSVKVALLEPFAIACMMQVYFRTIEGQTPDPAWEQRLDSLSAKFRKLKEKAVSVTDPDPQPAAAPAT